jgi:hypothetical protein
MADLTTFDPVGLSRADAGGLTYAEAWRQYTREALARAEKNHPPATGRPDANGFMPVAKQVSGGFDVTRATAREARDFFDKLCGGRKYDGPKWWVPGVVPGIEFYDGKG